MKEENIVKVALVTGASRGIGASIALGLAAEGFNIAVTSRVGENLREICQQILQTNRLTFPVELDVRKPESIEDVVNNAGVIIPEAALDLSIEQWDEVLDTNLRGLFFCSQAVAQHMRQRGIGKIVNISSAAGLRATDDRAHYGSSKAGLNFLTKNLAFEWAKFNITVNAVAPTFVRTDLSEQTLKDPKLRSYYLDKIPLGRFGTTLDVVNAVKFLVSPSSDFITGITLPIDGGFHL